MLQAQSTGLSPFLPFASTLPWSVVVGMKGGKLPDVGQHGAR
jgi:hypothetical protein